MLYANGNVYTGMWEKDVFCGTGEYLILVETKYIRYVCVWLNGKRGGEGSEILVDGTTYEGHYKKGKYHGIGKITFPDGGTYFGEWYQNVKHGDGEQIWPDGTKYTGHWYND